MSVDCECVVVGAGVAGLAVAARLAQAGREVIILEREAEFGSVTSARNSEVVHAGIYYAKNSLKAQMCVQGKALLYEYCQQRQIPVKQCGKLIVATDDMQRHELDRIRQRAQLNGVHDLSLLTASEAVSIEPQLACTGALLSPSTGIVDSHAYMLSLLGDAENHGATLVCSTPVDAIEYSVPAACYQVTTGGSQATTVTARVVINAAGHGACTLRNTTRELRQSQDIDALMYKGNYFSLSTRTPFSRLIYPVPEKAGLGVHLTIDMAGRARFGPDVEPVEHENYLVHPERAESFYQAIRRYWPGLPDNSLVPDYAGIRPRVSINGLLYKDFLIQGPAEHGLPGLVNLLGIESPGLTASLAIANKVVALLDG